MRLQAFSVKNFRSIHDTAEIRLNNNCIVLVGANNEGKSNLLQALNIAFSILDGSITISRRFRSMRYSRVNSISFENDFPIQKANDEEKIIEFKLIFSLSEEDFDKSHLFTETSKEIVVNISIQPPRNMSFSIKIDNKKNISEKDQEAIIHVINTSIYFRYIPAVRTAEQSLELIDDLVQRKLQTISDGEKYKTLLEDLKQQQEKFLADQKNRLQESLKTFIPAIKDVDLKIDSSLASQFLMRRAMRGEAELWINDGKAYTHLAQKGDGVISLVSLALMQQFFTSSRSGNCVLAIEEPESHLHPDAIHRIKAVLDDLAVHNQVILTTHNPIMVNTAQITANIIVEKNMPHIAQSLANIRSSLGVKVSDNLMSAEVVLLVEGEEDRSALEYILPLNSAEISEALKSKRLIIEALNGSGNILYKISEVERSVCKWFVFLDNDKAGRTSIDKLRNNLGNDKKIQPKDYLLTPCKNLEYETEFEDCIDELCYKDEISKMFSGKLFESKSFRDGKGNWSSRIKVYCQKSHMHFDDTIEKEMKNIVVECIKKSQKPLNRRGENIINELVSRLIYLLNNK